jgi:aryl-alcohol dehydrogenase-like predicted oxidoreductase
MQSLNVLINQGKVLYLGISDAPAWIVTKANMYARQHGLRPFSLYQGRYSAQERDLEREIIPMCRDEGMAIQPFGVLGGGYFKSPGDEGNGARQVPPPLKIGREQQLSTVLDPIAKKHQVPITSVALAYVLQKVSFHCLFSYILPVIRHNPSSY